MTSLGEQLTQALSADPIILQADARRLRGEEMRRMASALKRRTAAAFAGLAGRRCRLDIRRAVRFPGGAAELR